MYQKCSMCGAFTDDGAYILSGWACLDCLDKLYEVRAALGERSEFDRRENRPSLRGRAPQAPAANAATHERSEPRSPQ